MKLTQVNEKNSYRYAWLLSRIYPFIKPVIKRIILGFLIAVAAGALDGVVSFSLKPYMDYVIAQKDLHFGRFTIQYSFLAFIIPFGVVFFASIQGILRYLNDYFTDWTSQKITNSVKKGLFKKLLYMDSKFFDENKSGLVITRFLSDPDSASTMLVNHLKTLTTSFFGAFSLVVVMLYSSYKLALIGVIVLCVAFVPVALIRKRIKMASNQNMVVGGNITTNFNEVYSGNRVMTAYSLQEMQRKKFEDQIEMGFKINMTLVKRAGWMSPLMYLIASIGIATVLGYGTNLILSGNMTAGSFASFVTSLLLLYKPVKTLGNTLTGLQTIFVAMGRVFELFDMEPEIVDMKDAKELQGLNNCISFENVGFGYNKDSFVLRGINFSINKGQTLAIVGNSGGGKSTLVSLIPRFYDVLEGAIKIDGVDIREISLDSLRKNIAVVFQDNFLYSGTIRENIMMGNPKALPEDLERVVSACHVDEFVYSFKNGLDTQIGERGVSLSGGQRQRVAIARAMIRDCPIIILDEATSALDNKSESIVQKALDNLMKNKTVFIIAHRLSTIKNAQNIAVIEEGHLVEFGTFEELMRIENGFYKTLYEMQFRNQKMECLKS